MTLATDPAYLRQRLVETLYASRYLTDPAIGAAFAAVPRHHFATAVYRVDSNGQFGEIYGADDPGYLEAVYSDDAIVTQIAADGRPTSSSTQPGVMAVMLEALQLDAGLSVLEVGTGTGYNAALLSQRVGAENVTSIDIDPGLVADARRALDYAGYQPHLIAGDGLAGYPDREPYDRLIATCSVRRVPAAWMRQVKPGGIVMANMSYGVVPVALDDEGHGCGMFLRQVAAFIEARPADGPLGPTAGTLIDATIDLDGPIEPAGAAAQWLTSEPFEFFWRLILPDVQTCQLTFDDGTVIHLLGDGESTVKVDSTGAPTVVQTGARRLWDEISNAFLWWYNAGQPTHDRLGLTVTPEGHHTLWVDQPTPPNTWPLS